MTDKKQTAIHLPIELMRKIRETCGERGMAPRSDGALKNGRCYTTQAIGSRRSLALEW